MSKEDKSHKKFQPISEPQFEIAVRSIISEHFNLKLKREPLEQLMGFSMFNDHDRVVVTSTGLTDIEKVSAYFYFLGHHLLGNFELFAVNMIPMLPLSTDEEAPKYSEKLLNRERRVNSWVETTLKKLYLRKAAVELNPLHAINLGISEESVQTGYDRLKVLFTQTSSRPHVKSLRNLAAIRNTGF